MDTKPITRKGTPPTANHEKLTFDIRVVATTPSVYRWTPTRVQRLHEGPPANVPTFTPRGFTAGHGTDAGDPPATPRIRRGGRNWLAYPGTSSEIGHGWGSPSETSLLIMRRWADRAAPQVFTGLIFQGGKAP